MKAQLLQQPHRFEFFQAVRLIERELKAQGRPAADGDLAVSDGIRFRNSLSLAFPASQIEALRRVDGDDAAEAGHFELTPSFMGLLGLSGVLPAHYTERVAAHESQTRDDAPRAFLDLFSNRLVGLFYLAWKKHRLPMQYESDRREGFIAPLLSLVGLGFGSLRERLGGGEAGVDDESVAHLAGLLAHRPASAATLQAVLASYFGVPVRIGQFVGHWYALDAARRGALGRGNCRLGHDALLGERVWQRDLRIQIRLGPLARTAYRRFLPGGSGSRALARVLRLASSGPLEYELRPMLQAAEVTPARLDGTDGARLGQDSFLCTRTMDRDRDDAAFLLDPTH